MRAADHLTNARAELELSRAFLLAETAYDGARERGRCNTECPEELLADFLAERHHETLQAARVFIERLAAREAERRTRQDAEDAREAA
jgi:hypothetical protein